LTRETGTWALRLEEPRQQGADIGPLPLLLLVERPSRILSLSGL
jgi:hypothetical protein